ncbi:DUF6973 domain-containing protein [Luteirhabdus pelagi]|uniref:DUF6973 domain-containing protein n=1 Tax=Luteirhabdus pelagi TaxID=2792783 RepID=UPI00193A2BA3|nr:hypothetical protein [Luteirhabdus pelagi]
MNLWARIRSLSIGQLWQLSVLFLKHPLYIFPTLRATKRTFEICQNLYGDTHHKSNRANSFRHALWNILICQKTFKISKNEQKAVVFTQKVTDLYEKVTQNEVLDEAMDLHNNEIGRRQFLKNFTQNEAETVDLLKKMAKNAQKVSTVTEMKKFRDKLVFISKE